MKKQTQKENTTFISAARREQIISATIESLDEVGYAGISFSVIAKRAKISPALIPYHFKDKSELIDAVLIYLVEKSYSYILKRIVVIDSPEQKLREFIMAQLEYQSSNAAENTALLEIIFHSRTQDGVPYYKIDDDGDDPTQNILRGILENGKKKNIFGEFELEVLINIIQGAINEYTFQKVSHMNYGQYGSELVKMVFKLVSR